MWNPWTSLNRKLMKTLATASFCGMFMHVESSNHTCSVCVCVSAFVCLCVCVRVCGPSINAVRSTLRFQASHLPDSRGLIILEAHHNHNRELQNIRKPCVSHKLLGSASSASSKHAPPVHTPSWSSPPPAEGTRHLAHRLWAPACADSQIMPNLFVLSIDLGVDL